MLIDLLKTTPILGGFIFYIAYGIFIYFKVFCMPQYNFDMHVTFRVRGLNFKLPIKERYKFITFVVCQGNGTMEEASRDEPPRILFL